MPRLNLQGLVQDKLTVLFVDEPNKKNGRSMWRCRCECGVDVSVSTHELRRGQKSCINCSKAVSKHKMSHLKEYAVWAAMIRRCTNKKDANYSHYGGRGISVSERWVGDNGFANFISDMGLRPTNGHTLERVNNDGNYEPANCKWATRKEQCRNFRHNRMLTFNGEEKCISEWAEIHGMTHDTLSRRLKKGMSIKEALNTPIKKNKKYIDVDGVQMTISAAEKHLGFGSGTIGFRLKSGMSEYDAVHQPKNFKKKK